MTTSSTIVKASHPGVEVYGPRATRATQAEMELRRSTLLDIAREAQPASVRHIYYRAVVAGLVEKKETGYRKVQRQLLELRRAGRLPFHWIVDEGRRAHWPLCYVSPVAALQSVAYSYSRNPWQIPSAPRVEVWCESQSIAGTLMPLRDDYFVPIFPLGGQTSETFAWNAAKEYRAIEPVVILYAGDYDPAGLQIGSQLEGKLREYAAANLDLTFVRLGITDEQAVAMQSLGTEPKQRHWIDYDGHRHDFVGRAIEAEAVDPETLRRLFGVAIEKVAADAAGYDDVFARSKEIERGERARLDEFIQGWSE